MKTNVLRKPGIIIKGCKKRVKVRIKAWFHVKRVLDT